MNNKHFWLVERGSYVAILFLGLVEVCQLLASCLF